MNRTTSRTAFIATLGGLGALAFTSQLSRSPARAAQGRYAVVLTDEQWRGRLKPDAYAVLRHEATESAFSSPLDEEKRPGTYACAGCDLRLYDAKTKFDSGTGWPSFYAPLPHAIATKTDYSMGIPRTEVHCSRCGGHLGHVFDDGPQPTGLRYCMNGVALVFHAATKA